MAELLTFVLGDIFGMVTLFVGIAIGVSLALLWVKFTQTKPKTAAESDSEEDPTVFREQLAGMIQFTSHFTGDLNKHIELLENLEQKLAQPSEVSSHGDDGPSDKAVQLIAQITAANQRLKQRLESAEATLKNQAQELEDTLSEARTDALTQLLNRRAFDEERNRRWALWQRKQQPFSLLMLDIDYFKLVNDRFGHDAGDAVLKEVAARLSSVMRQTDYLARIGGEEMAILMPDGDWDSIVTVARKILNVIRALPVQYDDTEIEITVSCGLMSASHAESPESLMRGADEALYAAKKGGRNRGFLNTGENLVPIEEDPPEARTISPEALEETPKASNGESEVSAMVPLNELDAAANELKNRLSQLSQRAMPQ